MFLIKSKSTIQSKKYPVLRYTLTGLYRDYQIRIPSNRLYKKEVRFYSTLDNMANVTNINPRFLTGFIALRSLERAVKKKSQIKSKYNLFIIYLHSRLYLFYKYTLNEG